MHGAAKCTGFSARKHVSCRSAPPAALVQHAELWVAASDATLAPGLAGGGVQRARDHQQQALRQALQQGALLLQQAGIH